MQLGGQGGPPGMGPGGEEPGWARSWVLALSSPHLPSTDILFLPGLTSGPARHFTSSLMGSLTSCQPELCPCSSSQVILLPPFCPSGCRASGVTGMGHPPQLCLSSLPGMGPYSLPPSHRWMSPLSGHYLPTPSFPILLSLLQYSALCHISKHSCLQAT